MNNSNMLNEHTIDFNELQQRFGAESARDILRTLERMTGICEELVSAWSYEDRWSNVFHVMKQSEPSISATRH